MPPKVCPEGQILNPKTNRCVLINGKIGKQLVGMPAVQPHPQPQLHSKKKKIRVIDANILNVPIAKSQTTLRKPNGRVNVIVTLTINRTGAHWIEVINGAQKPVRKQSYVMQSTVSDYHERVHTLMRQGYTVFDVQGTTNNELEDLIKQKFVCRIANAQQFTNTKTSPIKVGPKSSPKPNKTKSFTNSGEVDVSKCANDSTITMLEPLNEVDPHLIISFSDGYCFEVNEVASFIIATDKFVNPLTKLEFSDKDITHLLRHSGLEASLLAQLKVLIQNLKRKQSSIKELYTSKRDLMEKILQLILYTGIIATNDYSDTFSDSQTALGIMSEAITKTLAPKERDTVLALQSPGCKLSMKWVLENYSTTCIHGVGYTITEIALHNIQLLGCINIIPSKLIYVDNETGHMIQFSPGQNINPNFAMLHVYAKEQNAIFQRLFARLGHIQINTKTNKIEFSPNDIYGTKPFVLLNKIEQYFETYLYDLVNLAYMSVKPVGIAQIKWCLKEIEKIAAQI